MDQEQQPKPIYLFISQNCNHCRELIQLIQQKPELAKRVQGVNVENTPKLPPGLTRVPGLFIDGKVYMGKDCFEWVNKFGEIEASPAFSSAGGFEASGYSFLDTEGDGPPGTGIYSFLGESNGSEGLDKKKIDDLRRQEEGGRSANQGISSNMEQLKNARMQNMGGGGSRPF